MGSEERWYTPRFYQELQATGDSAREILPLIIELIKPTSIIDLGCGTGQWLAAALKLGIDDVLGVDGPWVLKSKLAIPREKFLAHDLGQSLKLSRRFDLALSLEVAEHFAPSQARSLVELLCGAADRVLFSAAIPGQGGRHHLNEQWPSYWAAIFRQCGYACFDIVRPRLWQNPRVLWYYAQNCLLFAPAGSANLGLPTDPLPLVHPSLWSSQVATMNSFGKLIERLPKAFCELFRHQANRHS
ncbi:MAG: class I SAM-dependent methyltransferase [Acidobacteria bacterium]|nr:class I SAM-dependent methyltransferase [Acidobacteriota bacterium]